jgi:hypothetical protein
LIKIILDNKTETIEIKLPGLPIIPEDLTFAVFGSTIITSFGFTK